MSVTEKQSSQLPSLCFRFLLMFLFVSKKMLFVELVEMMFKQLLNVGGEMFGCVGVSAVCKKG